MRYRDLPTKHVHPSRIIRAIQGIIADTDWGGMLRHSVMSSNLRSVGYSADSQVLEIEFNAGTVYQYVGVSQTVYEELLNAASLGRYFSSQIKDAYPTIRVR
jgi:hypothetical protein